VVFLAQTAGTDRPGEPKLSTQMIMPSGMNREEHIREVASRLIAFYHPARLYPFGSAARGDSGTNSDLDFYVVLPDHAPLQMVPPASQAATNKARVQSHRDKPHRKSADRKLT